MAQQRRHLPAHRVPSSFLVCSMSEKAQDDQQMQERRKKELKAKVL